MQVDRLESFIVESPLESPLLFAMLHDDIATLLDAVAAAPPATAKKTPLLHKVAYLGKIAVLEALLKRCPALGPDDPFSPMLITPLHAAAAGMSTDAVRLLISAGANVHAATDGAAALTPMDVAIQKGTMAVVKVFLALGVTPLTHHLATALKCDHHDISVTLLKHHCRYEVLLGNEHNTRLLKALEACGTIVGSSKLAGLLSPMKHGGEGSDVKGPRRLHHMTTYPVYESAIGKVLQSRIMKNHSERLEHIRSVKLKPVDLRYGQWMKVRVHINLSLIGIVRYSGAVEAHEGSWLGLELHVPLGTHDGEVVGRRYYTTAPNYAMMCRSFEATAVTSATEVRLLQHHNTRYYQNVLNQERLGEKESLPTISPKKAERKAKKSVLS